MWDNTDVLLETMPYESSMVSVQNYYQVSSCHRIGLLSYQEDYHSIRSSSCKCF